MKKTYFAPKTTIFKVSLRQMITASPATQLKTNNAIDLSGAEEGGGTGTILNSRSSSSIWDD